MIDLAKKKANARSYRKRNLARYKQNLAKWRADNPDKVSAYQKAWLSKPVNRSRILLTSAKARAARRGLPFDLTLDDVQLPPVCPIFGTPFDIAPGVVSPNSPSVDRIDPSGGYVKGNVWVISHRANRIKSDATLEEFMQIARVWRSLAVKAGAQE